MEVLTDRSQIYAALISNVKICGQDAGRIAKCNLEIKPIRARIFRNKLHVEFKCELFVTGHTMRDFINKVPTKPILKLTDVNGFEYTLIGLRTDFGLRIAGDMETVTAITMTSHGTISKREFLEILKGTF